MATYTTRNDLIKPGYTDAADIDDLNDNFDFIDGSIAPCEWAKAVDPTVNDDVTLGYIIGSMWFNTTGHTLFICESNADGAALWRQLYPNATPGVLLANGTVPLTAAWDAGSYQIRAETFQSDVATGTAPFTVASTTRVSNLNAATCGTADSATNADTVDSTHASAFALLAGRAGGQTLYGGTAKDESMALYSNSNSATGYITLPNANLVIGTKATTAPNFALAIHEGAAGASNSIIFVDGDGSTARAGILKDSNDTLCFCAGDGSTPDAYIDATQGKLTDNNGFSATYTKTDPSASSSVIGMTIRPTWTGAESVSETFYGVYDAIFPEIQAGHTNSGSIDAYYTECMRNHNGAATDDDGTAAGLYALVANYGHYNLNTSMKGTTTNCMGLYLGPWATKGTITNLFGLYIGAPSTGGTITNQYPIYSLWDAQSYFQGQIYGAGNISALTFTDRTPHYDGDALTEIKKIKGKDGKIDHNTLPVFARTTIEGPPETINHGKKLNKHGLEVDDIEIVNRTVEDGRDLGAMISILVKAVQQLSNKLDGMYDAHADAEKRMAAMEARLKKLEKA